MERKKLISGKYTGRYLDLCGFKGNITMDLKVDKDQISGEYRIEILDEHSSEGLSGSVRGKIVKDEVQLELPISEEKDNPLRMNAVVGDAMPYAILGIFGQVMSTDSERFAGGVWICWNFKG